MKPAFSARNRQASAMSSGVPTRPTGCCLRSSSEWCGVRARPEYCQSRVSIQPGLIALTRMRGPRLMAIACVRATMPPFEAAYASVFGSDIFQRVEAMLMMAPPLSASVIARAAACDATNADRSPTASARSKSAVVNSRNGLRTMMPALLTRTSGAPNSPTVLPIQARTAVSSPASASVNSPRPPSWTIMPTASSPASTAASMIETA